MKFKRTEEEAAQRALQKQGKAAQLVKLKEQQKERGALARAEQRGLAQEAKEARKVVRLARMTRRHATTDLMTLKVSVYDGTVYTWAFTEAGHRPLGDLLGASAQVAGSDTGHRRTGGERAATAVAATALLGPVGLLGGVSRRGMKGQAIIVFANGKVHTVRVDHTTYAKALGECVQFNALADAAGRTRGLAAEADTADEPQAANWRHSTLADVRAAAETRHEHEPGD